MEEVTLLAQVPLFASLKPAYLAELAGKLTSRGYRRGETIFHKDDPGSALYIIKAGQIKISAASPEGEEVILAILTEGDFFGELSLLDGKPRSASATAMEAAQTLTLDRDDLLEVLGKYPEMAGDILAALSDRLRRTDLLLEDAVFLDLPARLAKRLLELGAKRGFETDKGLEIDLRLTQQD
ncbi:MAG: Crp/Fnr family transcriptional regulator, partial [Dehalococcoidia bacterium]